jgi:hypothetical protein
MGYDHRLTAQRFEPEAARIRAEAAELLDQITNPNRPPRRTPDMPPITDTTSRLAASRAKKLRTNLGLTLAQLADMLSTHTDWSPSVSQLSNIERCQRSLSLPELAALANVLDTTVDHLIRHGEICEACGQELPR